MNLIPYNYFIYINYILSLGAIAAAWFFSGNNAGNIGITVFALAALVISAISQNHKYPSLEVLQPRFVLLGLFVTSIFVTFLPYLLNIQSFREILWVCIVYPCLTLLSIFLVSVKNKEQE